MHYLADSHITGHHNELIEELSRAVNKEMTEYIKAHQCYQFDNLSVYWSQNVGKYANACEKLGTQSS